MTDKTASPRIPLSDERIVALYLARDEKAIEETDLKYRSYLFTVAFRVLHDTQGAEDCLQDTYLSTWNAIPPRIPRVLRAFLATVARRAAIKEYRRAQKKSHVPSELTLSLSELEGFIAKEDDVEAHFDANHLGRVISDFVRSLSGRRQYLFLGRYYMSQPIDEIAEELGLSRSTVNKELARIRSQLKNALEKEGYLL